MHKRRFRPLQPPDHKQCEEITDNIRRWGLELGFQQVGFSGIDLSTAENRLNEWLAKRFHGSMSYMERHGIKRSRPPELIEGTVSVISVRMDYLTEDQDSSTELLDHPTKAYVSRYALGRDYHKLMRKRLARLAGKIADITGEFGHRVFVDSAPVLEKAIAEQAGLGWIGKHTNLINRNAGSWFFLGEIYTDLPLHLDSPESDHCGTCRACIDVCPTDAIVAPFQLDARRCISYLTIEKKESIPHEFRRAIGNRIYGCDDCQLFCPWNKFAKHSAEDDFKPRHSLQDEDLCTLFKWTEAEFLSKTEGSAIRRIGHVQWLRNIAVALGNAATSTAVANALQLRREHESDIVREHVEWAIQEHEARAPTTRTTTT